MSFDLVRNGLSKLGFERALVDLWCNESVVPDGEDFALSGGEFIDIENQFGEVFSYVFEQQPEGNIVFKLIHTSDEDYDDNYFPQ